VQKSENQPAPLDFENTQPFNLLLDAPPSCRYNLPARLTKKHVWTEPFRLYKSN